MKGVLMYKFLTLPAISFIACFALSAAPKVNPEVKHMVDACVNKAMPTACYELGILYEKGLGVPLDSNQSQAYYKKACELQFDKACEKVKKEKQ